MNNTSLKSTLDRLAARVEADPIYVGYAFTRFRREHGLSAEGLALALGVSVDTLEALASWHRPLPTTPSFAANVRAISTLFGVRPYCLVWVLVDGADCTGCPPDWHDDA